MRRALLAVTVAACVLMPLAVPLAPTTAARASVATPAGPTPVFAYYYIWFDPSSWNRAKSDLPLLGKYSSDDAKVMRQHVKWAKQAGIDGFIVSWKNTPTLDRRLALLVRIARAEHFSLEVIYQGLDFHRRPLPVDRVAADFEYFARTYADREPFRRFSKPLLIWSGTWEFSATDIARVTALVRPRVMVLASEKNVTGYERVADLVDGDAYYWSSVNPTTNHGYLGKLIDFSQAVHRNGGLWIAPAAPGFDARKVGGTSIVARENGTTFQRELAAASASTPDAIGVISWNEFSENSYIEPSEKTGYRYLDVLASSLGLQTTFPSTQIASDPTDSSSPGTGLPTGLIVAPIALGAAFFSTVVVVRRNGSSQRREEKRAHREARRRRKVGAARRRNRSARRGPRRQWPEPARTGEGGDWP